jgi:hypothetical protein
MSEQPQYVMTEPMPPQDEFEDYWSFSQKERFMLPDGKQWIEFNIMNEGQKASYQKKINKDIKFNRKTSDATIRSDIADERHALIETSVTGWYMLQGGNPANQVAFSVQMLRNWLNVANPRIVENLEVAIRKANPWLMGDMTLDDIDEEIQRLQELRIETEKREQGK